MHISMCKLLVFSLPSSNNKDEFQSTVLEGKLGSVFFYMWKILQNHCYMKTREYVVKISERRHCHLKVGHNTLIFLVCTYIAVRELTKPDCIQLDAETREPLIEPWSAVSQNTA